MTRRTENTIKALMWLVYSVVVTALSVYHEPWNDELIAWDIALSNTPVGIFAAMAEEGHFCVWHLLLYPFAQWGVSSTLGLPIVSCALMIAAAWLLIYRSPMGLWASLLVLVSYPALYYFPVVSRVYALIPLALWLIAICYPHRLKAPVLYGLALGLLINTHIYMEGLALGLLLCWVIDVWRLSAPERRRPWVGIAVTFALGLFALSQIVGNLFIETSPAIEYSESLPRWALGNVEASMSILEIVPLLDVHQGVRIAAGLAIMLAMFVWYCRMLRQHPILLCVVAVAFLFQFAFAVLVYNGYYQRRYLMYFIFVFGFWVGQCKGRQPVLWLLLALVCSLPLEIKNINYDICHRYADESYINTLLREDTHSVKYIGIDDLTMHKVVYCFGKPAVDATMFDDEPQLLQLVLEQRPDSFLLCHMFGGHEVASSYPPEYGDSCNTALAATMAGMGYRLDSSQRYDSAHGPVYINTYTLQPLPH